MNIMLARQPIFDSGERVIGYQIFHPVQEPGSAGDALLEALLQTGIQRLTRGEIAFVDISSETLLTGAVELLDPRGVVLAIDGRTNDPDVVERCREYRSRGYHLALNADPGMDPASPLLELVEMARLNVQNTPPSGLRWLTEQLRSRRIHLLAEGVENARQRDECVELGFRLFQGVLFNQPEIVPKKDLAVEHLQVFRLLKDIRNPDVDDAQIVDTFRSDPGLTYRFLRVVNSAAVGGQQVDSIGYAIRLMGRDSLSRWLSLLLLSPFAGHGVNAEIASTALVRARFCELLAEKCGRPWAADSLFTVGLFSRLDLLLGTTLEHIVEEVAFTDQLRVALLERVGPDGEVLALVEAYESGRWSEVTSLCESLGIDDEELPDLHFEALGAAGDASPSANAASAPAARQRAGDQPGWWARVRQWAGSLFRGRARGAQATASG